MHRASLLSCNCLILCDQSVYVNTSVDSYLVKLSYILDDYLININTSIKVEDGESHGGWLELYKILVV